MLNKRTAPTAGALALALALTSCGGDDAVEETAPEELQPEEGTEIPEVTVVAGWSPIGDGLIPVIGERLGYFEDAGITFTEEDGLQTDLFESLTPLLNNQIEIGATYMPLLTHQFDTVHDEVTPFMMPTVSHALKILAPEGEYDTVSDLMDEGMSFEEAAAEAAEQIRGEEMLLFTGIEPEFYELAFSHADMTLSDVETTYMDDPTMVTAAQAGEADFVSPNGAVQVSQLQQSGWEVVIDIADVIEYMPEEAMSLSNTMTGFVTTFDYAEENWNTLLRFTSVMFRIVDHMEEDVEGATEVFVDYVNSYTGSDMSAEEAARLFTDGLYFLQDFDEYADVVLNEDTAKNYYQGTDAQVERLQAQGVLQDDHDTAEISIADRIYQDLVEYRDQAEELIETAPEGELKEQAETFYEQFNYLDAYRLALTANEED